MDNSFFLISIAILSGALQIWGYIVYISKSLKNDTLRLFDITTKIDVITNFIDIKKIEAKVMPCKRDLLAPKSHKIITHISNFRPLKRIQDVIKIFEK